MNDPALLTALFGSFDLIVGIGDGERCIVSVPPALAPVGFVRLEGGSGGRLDEVLTETVAPTFRDLLRSVERHRTSAREELWLADPRRGFEIECRPTTGELRAVCLVRALPVDDELRPRATRPTTGVSEAADDLLASVIADIQQGVLIQGPSAEILMSNARALELLGLTEAQLLGRTSFDPEWRVVDEHDRDLPGERHPVPLAIATRQPVLDLVMGVHRPSTHDLIWLSVSAVPRLDDAGEVELVVCSFTEITDAIEARREAERERALLSQVMDTAQVGIVVLDRDGRATFANRTAERISGVGENGLLGVTYDDPSWCSTTWDGTPIPVEELGVSIVLRTGRPVTHHDVVITNAMGERRYLRLNAAPLLDPRGEVTSVVATLADVSERVAFRKSQDRMRDQVEQLAKQESLSMMAGGVAHDFNNLLVGVLGASGLALLELEPDHPATPHVEVVEETAEAAAHLTRQLLAYSGRGQFEPGPLDVSAIVEDVASLLEAIVGKHIQVDIEPELDLPSVEVDETALRQIIVSLSVNAAEAIVGSRGLISVRTGQLVADEAYLEASPSGTEDAVPGRYVWVEVEDDGCGIPEASIGRIFDPFFTTKETGHGLGLSAVLGAVQSHGGFIRVTSAVDRGTVVRVGFPTKGAAVPLPAPAPVVRDLRLDGSILVIDDEDLVRVVTERILTRAGCDVVSATDGMEGLQRFTERADAWSAVVLDITMPGLNGEDVLIELRQIRPDIPILLMSGYTDLAVEGALAEANAFIQKPFRPDELLRALAAVVQAE